MTERKKRPRDLCERCGCPDPRHAPNLNVLVLQPPHPGDAFLAENVPALDHRMPRRHGSSYDPANESKFAAKKDGNRAALYELGRTVHDQLLTCKLISAGVSEEDLVIRVMQTFPTLSIVELSAALQDATAAAEKQVTRRRWWQIR